MKKTAFIVVLILAMCQSVFSQKQVPIVDYKGHIIRGTERIGTLSHAGSFDKAENPITRINSMGQAVDSNGKVIGKPAKGNSFIYYNDGSEEKYSIGKSNHSGMCEVKNTKGEVVMLLHKNYKQEAACAIHCLYENKCMPMK
jgi:hypothetical protein